MKFLDDTQKNQIGFKFIMDELNLFTCYGIDKKKSIKPFGCKRRKELLEELENLDIIFNSYKKNKKYYNHIHKVFCRVKDIRNSIKKTGSTRILDEVELYEIKTFTMICDELYRILDKLNLNINTLIIKDVNEVLRLLDPEEERIPTFYIYESYSQKLCRIREEKRKIENRIMNENDEVKIQELKKYRLDIVVKEEEEERRIRVKLTQQILGFREELEWNIKVIGELDLLLAKAILAEKYGAIKPIISEDMTVKLNNVINPRVKYLLEKKNKRFTPISIELDKGVAIVTGANMGGKSITLQTTVLNVYLANLGFFVFGNYAVVPVVDFVQFISDDMQSVSKGLSTFGAEIISLNKVIECAKRGNGFIVLDEFARGTNPKEGNYLVKAVCKFLNKFNSITLVSTHYDGVGEKGMRHYEVRGLKGINFNSLKYKIDLNKRFSVEIIQENMDYRLDRVEEKNVVPKDALNIAILLGVENEIVDTVKSFFDKEDGYEK